jgi:hypothetical protein
VEEKVRNRNKRNRKERGNFLSFKGQIKAKGSKIKAKSVHNE